ncbi:MAG: zf-HC2 domain-containing protein [Pseudomonadota bacterium]|nr:zf-HC2 domain-containing protein [Pseudomonadota bacterium]
MINKNDISNELLNAYLDNELDSEERAEIMAALENDAAMARRLCELRNTKELTQFAYSMTHSSQSKSTYWKYGKQYASLAVAATLFLTVGALVGWFAHDGISVNSFVQGGQQQMASDASLTSLPLEAESKKVILHIDTGDAGRLKAALDSAEDLLVTSQANGNPLELEIIANADGLDLLRVDTAIYADRISKLSEKYDNLSILACSRAIKRLQDLGVKVQLVPEAGIAPSALDQIVHRLKQGWVYIKV